MAKVWWRAPVIAVAALVAAHAGCSTKTCTEAGCQDQFRAKIASADGGVPVGAHVVEVVADGVTTTCTFRAGGGTAVAQCPPGLDVGVGQEQDCKEVNMGSAVGLVCTPIAGRFFETVRLTGKPAHVQVRITIDGAVVLDRTIAPTYEAAQPNGPGCDPICHQASVAWTL